MKTTQKLLLATLFAAAATLANAQQAGQYVSDGPFGPLAQVTTQKSAVDRAMASPAGRAMDKADNKATTSKPSTSAQQVPVAPARATASFFTQLDSAR
jgi:hypothetical protein